MGDGTGRCLQAQTLTTGAGIDAAKCDGSGGQRFWWDKDGAVKLDDGKFDLCLTASTTIRPANKFWARNLKLGSCATTADANKQFTYYPEVGAA